jgi:CheY-like chemotaxis protein
MTPGAPDRRPRVLVIDDDAQLRDFVRAVLGANGYEVEEADDGAPGLRAVRRRAPDLILCDMFMPEQDGLRTVAELRKVAPRVPVVAMSGGGAVCLLDPLPFAARLGAARTLPKPFSDQTLLAAVAAALRAPSPPDADGA